MLLHSSLYFIFTAFFPWRPKIVIKNSFQHSIVTLKATFLGVLQIFFFPQEDLIRFSKQNLDNRRKVLSFYKIMLTPDYILTNIFIKWLPERSMFWLKSTSIFSHYRLQELRHSRENVHEIYTQSGLNPPTTIDAPE